jgi:hypothetical protein
VPKPEEHAPANSVLGLLQRGRGEGYRLVVSLPKNKAWPLLIECICNDPRLDSQVESRAEYYAEIALKIELDLSPIGDYLRKYDGSDPSGWDTSLAVKTLDELSKRGHQRASEMLLDYVRWGALWEQPFYNSGFVRSEGFIKGAVDALEDRFRTDEELKEAIDWSFLDQEPWLSILRHSTRMAKFRLNSRRESELQPEKDFSHLDSLSVSELLGQEILPENQRFFQKAMEKVVCPRDVDLLVSHVTAENPAVGSVALAGLAKVAPASIFDWLTKFWSDNPELRGIINARARDVFVALPPELTMPLARKWLFHERGHERWLAQHLIREHATTEDISILRRAITEAMEDDDANAYRICDLVEAFGNLPNIGVIQELCQVFAEFRYSYGRKLAAKAISATSPEYFAGNLAFECLWDCEPETRELAAERVPSIDGGTRERLEELSGEAFEDEDVRQTALERLKGRI